MSEDHGSEQPVSGESDEEVEQQPLNRAERRAQKKGGSRAQSPSKNVIAPKHNQSAGPRLWSNRRSG